MRSSSAHLVFLQFSSSSWTEITGAKYHLSSLISLILIIWLLLLFYGNLVYW